MNAFRCYFLHIFICLLFVSPFYAQILDLEGLDKQISEKFQQASLSVSGSFSSNGVYYTSSTGQGRQPFTYFLNGNLHLSFYHWSVPLSFTYTNQGSNFKYELPFRFNRLSLHPKYKWLQLHIGDASMNFSSYTYNGLPFTGLGLEVVSEDFPLRLGVMGGKLQKSVEYNPEVRESRPYYERWGYGVDLQWIKTDYELRGIGFYAKDKENSLSGSFPSELNVRPEQGLTYSLFAKVKPLSFLDVYAEYAVSKLVTDIRLEPKSVFSFSAESSQMYDALNAGMNFLFSFGTVGLRYERIDPEYRTLGAYYFVNDMENITLNSSLNLFKNRLNLTTSIGKQRDNLDRQKVIQSDQWVGSVNAAIKPLEKLDISLNYSNFTSFTNRKLNQFDDINQNPLHLQSPEDSLNYQQISQNLSTMIQYQLSDNQQLGMNYTVNDVVNKENNKVRTSASSRFHNVGLTYSVKFPNEKLLISPIFNYTKTEISGQNSHLLGPSLNVNKLFFDDKLSTSLGSSYNYGEQLTSKSRNVIIRAAMSYVLLKRHQFQLSAVQTLQHTTSGTHTQRRDEFMLNFGYNYHLEKTPLVNALQWKRKKSESNERKDKRAVAERNPKQQASKKQAKTSTKKMAKPEETSAQIVAHLTSLKSENQYEDLQYMPSLQWRLDSILQNITSVANTDKERKKQIHLYQRTLEEVQQKERELSVIVFNVLNKLYREAQLADSRLKQRVLDSKLNLDKTGEASQEKALDNSLEMYAIHHHMKKDFYGLSLSQITNSEGVIKEFLLDKKKDMYAVLDKKRATKEQKMTEIQLLIVDYYYKKYKEQAQ